MVVCAHLLCRYVCQPYPSFVKCKQIPAAEQAALQELQQQHGEAVQAALQQGALFAALEEQEAAGRMEVAEQQAAGLVGLAERQAGLAGQVADTQGKLRASQQQCGVLEAQLEEMELALSRVRREMEAVQDSQAVVPDAGAQQRELSRSEAERRAGLAAEQRSGLLALEESERSSRAVAMSRERASVEQAEVLARQALSEEQARELVEVGGAMHRAVQAMLGQQVLAAEQAVIEGEAEMHMQQQVVLERMQAVAAEMEARWAVRDAEQAIAYAFAHLATQGRGAGCLEFWNTFEVA